MAMRSPFFVLIRGGSQELRICSGHKQSQIAYREHNGTPVERTVDDDDELKMKSCDNRTSCDGTIVLYMGVVSIMTC